MLFAIKLDSHNFLSNYREITHVLTYIVHIEYVQFINMKMWFQQKKKGTFLLKKFVQSLSEKKSVNINTIQVACLEKKIVNSLTQQKKNL